MKFEITHVLPADRDTVVAVLSESGYYEYIQKNHSGVDRIEMISIEDAGSSVRRKVHYQAKPIIRSVGPKKVPPEAMAWVEESTFDKAACRLDFTNVAVLDWVRRRLSNHGTIEFRDGGSGRTVRVIAGELRVKFPILGAIAERIIYAKAKGILDEEARLFGEYLKSRQHPVTPVV